jgi:hypothetical protein
MRTFRGLWSLVIALGVIAGCDADVDDDAAPAGQRSRCR